MCSSQPAHAEDPANSQTERSGAHGDAVDGDAVDGDAVDGDAVDGDAVDGDAVDATGTSRSVDARSSEGSSPSSSEDSPFGNFEEALKFAENSFAFGDHHRVVRVLEEKLYPEPAARVSEPLLIEAYTYLGVSAHFEGDMALAEQAFSDLLSIDPTWELDPFVYPPEVIAFYDALKEEKTKHISASSKDGNESTVFIESRVRKQSILVSMLPFGYGLIANGQTEWGVFYALTEATLLATTASMFWINRANRIPSESLTTDFGYENPALARRRQRVQIGTGIAFLTVLTANIIHGAVTHDRVKNVRYRTLDRPPKEFESSMNDESRSKRWNIRITPVLELSR